MFTNLFHNDHICIRRGVRAMKKHFVYFLPLFLVIILTGCTRHHTETLVATIGDQSLSLQEYENTFVRLNGGRERGEQASLDEREEFLDLLVKFKLKIQDAYDSGLHKEPEIQAELEEYRKSLGAAFLIERELVEPALREMYKRRSQELRASHILIRMPSNPSPEDTLQAYEKAMEVISKLDAGESFADLAAEYSDDPGASTNYGDLHYFSGGMMVRPFEDAVYNLDVGEVTTTPVRTQFGYHIIKLTDRQPAPGGRRVSHIMRFAPQGASPQDTLQAYNKIHELLDSLNAGADFAELAREYSEDRQTAVRNGELGLIQQRRSLPPDFENVAFQMDAGTISDVVRTDFGFHIINVTEVEPIPSYEEMKDDLRRQYQSRYFDEDHRKFVENLKEKYSFERHDENIETLIEAVDTTWFADTIAWQDSIDASVASLALFSINNSDITVEQAAQQIQANPEFTGRRLMPNQLRNMITRVEQVELINKDAEGVGERYPDIADKVDEYREGILIYYIEQKRVWEEIDLSDERLLEYYEENKERYTFPDRVNICEIVVRSDSLANALYDRILAGEDMEELAEEYTIRSGMKRQRGVTGLVNADRDQLTEHGFSQEVGEISEPFQVGQRYAIVKTLEREPERIKTFDEARAQLTGEYQDKMATKLEEEWVERLRERYQVALFPEKLEMAFTVEDE